jgi:hypothetical protein
MNKNSIDTGSPEWKILFIVGGIAPMITLLLYMSQFLILLSGKPYPATPEGWFLLFQESKLLGLFFLNALDIISVSLIGVMFLALYVALRKINPSWMLIATFIALLGVATFVSSRAVMVSGTLALSDLFATATSEIVKSQILAAGYAVTSLSRATPETIGWFFIALAGLTISVIMLIHGVASKGTAIIGILAGVVTFANHISFLIAPSFATVLMPVNGLLWIIWWLLISIRLLRWSKAGSIEQE